ncbi:hypothetical protein IRJ41_016689, partial [Triplophysa rosa]
KQVYRVPFERNSERVKDLRHQYVQCLNWIILKGYEWIFVDESPGQRGGNITLCAAISNHGVLSAHATLGPYNTEHLLTFLYGLRNASVDREQQNHQHEVQPVYVVVWDYVSFHRGVQIRQWFNNNQQFINVILPPYSPFLNPIEEFFSAWRWKVYDRNPYTRENLLQAMELACGDIDVQSCQGWIHHTRGFFARCLARDNIACNVDEVLWPDPAQRHDPEEE